LPAVRLITFLSAFFLFVLSGAWGQKPPLTLDDFFSSVEIRSLQISPDGHEVVIETVRRDFPNNRYRSDLWLYRDSGAGSLVQLTRSGHDSGPQWSPDGLSVAFFSDRESTAADSTDTEHAATQTAKNAVAQVYVVSSQGGEAFPISSNDLEIRAFAWSANSHSIYFAARDELTNEQNAVYQDEWKDVVQYRESERGDTVFGVEVASAEAGNIAKSNRMTRSPKPSKIATVPYRIDQMAASPDGNFLALTTSSRSGRLESSEPYGVYLVDLPQGGAPRLVLHTLGPPEPWAAASDAWSPDSRQILFSYGFGTPEGPLHTPQTRLYSISLAGGKSSQWASGFRGDLEGYSVNHDGSVICAARIGTAVKAYVAPDSASSLVEQTSWDGTYELISVAQRSSRVAFVFSSLQRPDEVYLADGPDKLGNAQPITAFNRLFTERELPNGKPYRWKADDDVDIEGMLIYPPGKFGARHLPMLTLIHGGPAAADGNRFVLDWDQWSALAATQGWLVFEPNYRGSVGYGDAFTLGLVAHTGSRPGSDILQGIDCLVKDDIADPARLTVGGYSFGGYLTNWLITQTTRFKAAVTGAGDVEFVVGWGNNKDPLAFAYSLGGAPWEAEPNYNAQAPIWKIGKVTTPTHIVAGAEDINVFVGEDYLLERALTARGIPNSLLIFPGEGHGLEGNPWHGKIKVREELKWLEKYGGKPLAPLL
jgi:dipeptidyl aminopeptidase/acylaminoacyl peptidase